MLDQQRVVGVPPRRIDMILAALRRRAGILFFVTVAGLAWGTVGLIPQNSRDALGLGFSLSILAALACRAVALGIVEAMEFKLAVILPLSADTTLRRSLARMAVPTFGCLLAGTIVMLFVSRGGLLPALVGLLVTSLLLMLEVSHLLAPRRVFPGWILLPMRRVPIAVWALLVFVGLVDEPLFGGFNSALLEAALVWAEALVEAMPPAAGWLVKFAFVPYGACAELASQGDPWARHWWLFAGSLVLANGALARMCVGDVRAALSVPFPGTAHALEPPLTRPAVGPHIVESHGYVPFLPFWKVVDPPPWTRFGLATLALVLVLSAGGALGSHAIIIVLIIIYALHESLLMGASHPETSSRVTLWQAIRGSLTLTVRELTATISLIVALALTLPGAGNILRPALALLAFSASLRVTRAVSWLVRDRRFLETAYSRLAMGAAWFGYALLLSVLLLLDDARGRPESGKSLVFAFMKMATVFQLVVAAPFMLLALLGVGARRQDW